MKVLKIKVVIFDAQGMMIKGRMLSDCLIDEYGINRDRVNSFFKNEFLECMRGKAYLRIELQKLCDDKSLNSEDILNTYNKEETKKDDRFIEIVHKLKSRGIFCILATNHEKYRLNYIKNNLGFNKIFDLIVASCEVGFLKSDKGFFEFILNKLKKYERKSIMYWDDRETNVALAKSFGLNAEVYKSFDGFLQKLI